MVKVNKQTYVTGGTIRDVMVLTAANSPYVFVGDILIPPKCTLSIEPGVTVKFGGDVVFPSLKPNLTIKVLGSMKAVGTKDKRILFTTNEGIPSWGGIIFETSANDCTLQYCDLEAAASKIICSSAFVTIEDTVIRKDKKPVVTAEEMEAKIKEKEAIQEKEKKASKYTKYRKTTGAETSADTSAKEKPEPEEGGGCLGF
jgi:hypothetical protein